MKTKRYVIVQAGAIVTLQNKVESLLARGYEPVGGIYGSLGQDFMQSMVGEEDGEDETSDDK